MGALVALLVTVPDVELWGLVAGVAWALPVEGSYDTVRKVGRPGTTPSCDSRTLCVHGIRSAGPVRM